MAIQVKGYYAGEEITFDLPDNWKLLAMGEPKDVPGVPDLAAEVIRSVENPVACDPASKLAKTAKKCCIAVEDTTRPSPTGEICDALIPHLVENGLAYEDIHVMVARGTHIPPADDEQLIWKIGQVAFEKCGHSVHDADDPELFVTMGTTTRFNDVEINHHVAEADLVIGIGTINPHYFAGYGGGPKLMLPGTASRNSIRRNHSLIWHTNTMPTITNGNPVWSDMLEAARIAGLTMKMDCVLQTEGKVAKIVSGEVEKEQEVAIDELNNIYGMGLPRQADIVITSSYPLESDLIQSGKALLAGEPIAKDGGTVVLITSAPDGPGPLYYETLAEKPTEMEVVDWIGQGKASPTGGPMASRVRKLLMTKGLVLVTKGVEKERVEEMDMQYAATIEEALADLEKKYPEAEVVVFPVGGSTNPYIDAAAAD